MIAAKPLEPVIELSPEEYYRDRTEITTKDTCDFSTINEVCKILFDTTRWPLIMYLKGSGGAAQTPELL
jgi:hypothetical protein